MSYGEPWRAGYASSDKLPVPVVSSTSNLNVGIIGKIEDADRIVACVNACAGIPTEDVVETIELWKEFYFR